MHICMLCGITCILWCTRTHAHHVHKTSHYAPCTALECVPYIKTTYTHYLQQAYICSSDSPYHSSLVDPHSVCSKESPSCPTGQPNINTMCCSYLEYVLSASCEGMPKKDLKGNIAKMFTCVDDPTASSCHNPPRFLFTRTVPKGPRLTERTQGQGVAVVGTSAYFFGGEHPGHVLSDSFWQLDGSKYPPARIDLNYVSCCSR
jgi:hypothetical protein